MEDSLNAEVSVENQGNLPGGPIKLRPMKVNGIDYHPLHPPRLHQNPDGSSSFRGGKELIESSVVINDIARKVWSLVVYDHPDLRDISFENPDPLFEQQNPKFGGRHIHPQTPDNPHKIILPRDWKRAVSYPRTPEGTPILELIAAKIGIPTESVTDDMLATFVVLHEAGHALDSKGVTYEEQAKKREAEMNTLPARSSGEYFQKFPNATADDLKGFLEQYRNLPSEAKADGFAGSFIKNHMDLFF